jgi:hypothetical protein
MTRRATAAAAALVLLATLAVYWRALDAGFHGDDFMILHRLRALAAPADVLRFFRGEFFEYYRPLPFVLHAIDWAIAGANAWQFHFTNLLLHLASAILVLLIGRTLSPRSLAGPIAAALFALHAANHEAVVWISARFDLVATLCGLAAVWCTVRDARWSRGVAPLLFFAAILSKESVVALPAAAASFYVFIRRASTRETIVRLAPWIAALVVYAVLRNLAGGVSPVGGASRLPKLIALAVMLSGLVLLAGGRWLRVRDWLAAHRGAALGAAGLALAVIVVAAAAGGTIGRLAAEKLAVAGFAGFHLASPFIDLRQPFYLDAETTMYWAGGAIVVVLLLALLAWLWRGIVADDRQWFIAGFILATLLPISALTEGTRYLYLPSAAVSLALGVYIAERQARSRTVAYAFVAILLAASIVQVTWKVNDWIWAGRMTAEGAHLVDSTRPSSCEDDHVVFLTEPVAVRGVYTHFLYDTFELPRGCMPAVFQIVIRMMRVDTPIEVAWDGPSRIVMTAPSYEDNFVASRDLREFDVPLKGKRRATIVDTPLGELRAEADGALERITLTLAEGERRDRIRFFYYSDGKIRPLAKP